MGKKTLLFCILGIGILCSFITSDLPKGWIKTGDSANSYEMGVDKGAGQNGINAGTIKSIAENITGFGTLMEQCVPGIYRGKRVRMSGYMKTKDVKNWSSFWFRVDNELAFDNMHDGNKDRSIKGTTDWTKYEIVLDVPTNATRIAFGALIDGTGQIWFDNLKFEVVDNSVETTGQAMKKGGWVVLEEPTNLDFAQ
jgi:hypothetical protein